MDIELLTDQKAFVLCCPVLFQKTEAAALESECKAELLSVLLQTT